MLQALRKLIRPINNDPAVEVWLQQYRRTPDLWFLSQHTRQLVFFPDDFKLGHKRHEKIEGHLPIHPSVYTLGEYTVYKKDLGEHSFPLPFEKGVDFEIHSWYKPELARIQGELYALPVELFWKVLDIEKENGLQFTRKRVMITCPWREVRHGGANAELWDKVPTISKDCLRTVPAWMYVARPEYWENYIGVSLGTRAVPMYEHNTPKFWIEKYYKF